MISPATQALMIGARTHSIYFFVQSVPFTRAVIEGRTSLGGSESACLGLASALSRLGHDVHIFATQLQLDDSDPSEYNGVQWHPAETLFDTTAFAPPDVFCALRSPEPFAIQTGAALNLLWNQDLLRDVTQVSGALPQIDALVYVSDFHRQQWAGVDEKILGAMPSMVTRNGVDEKLIEQGGFLDFHEDGTPGPAVPRRPYQFAHISRPERGLAPLLQIWPRIRARLPEATLHICRYDSMYDAQGWGRICAQYDDMVAQVQARVGGIVMEGQLDKVALYRLLHASTMMLYPGVTDFAETNCIAAAEAQACGSVFIGSYRGALPETLGPGAGILIDGDAHAPAYQERFVQEVCALVDDPERLASMRAAGRAHVFPSCAFDTLAREWTAWIAAYFENRYRSNKVGVLRSLLRWDNHVAAKLVCRDIVDSAVAAGEFEEGGLWTVAPPAAQEAHEADLLCDRVIAQEDLNEADYSTYALGTEEELQISARIHELADSIAELKPATVLDVACGNGAMIVALCRRLPDLHVVGYDFSAAVLATAQAAVQAAGFAGRVELRRSSWEEVRGQYGAVFCGEFVEHVEQPHLLINRLEQHCLPEGRIFITTPCGPFADLLHYTIPRKRGHTHAFSMDDVRQLFGNKPGVSWGYMPHGRGPRGAAVGVWMVSWAPGGPAAPPLDYTRTILTARPYKRVVAAMIVRDEEEWIRRCLGSIYAVVDDIVILDTGSRDKTCAIAEEFGAHIYPWAWQHDFAAARNESLRLAVECHQADWVLWIDADEHLVQAQHLRKYLVGDSPFLAFVIRQHHLMLDADRFCDIPCRLFRTDRGIRFFGKVHEQPSIDPNDGLFPALDTPDLNIVHYGYETEQTRRGKLLDRNLNLLKAEVREPSPRDMAWLLLVRELVTLAGYEGAGEPATQTDQQRRKAQAYLRAAITIYRKHGFDDPSHKLHHLIFASYGLALKWLGLGVEIEWAFAASPGNLKGHPRPERIRVGDAAEGVRLVEHKIREWMKGLAPFAFACAPWKQARAADFVSATPTPAAPEQQAQPIAFPPPAEGHHPYAALPSSADEAAVRNAEDFGDWTEGRLGSTEALL